VKRPPGFWSKNTWITRRPISALAHGPIADTCQCLTAFHNVGISVGKRSGSRGTVKNGIIIRNTSNGWNGERRSIIGNGHFPIDGKYFIFFYTSAACKDVAKNSSRASNKSCCVFTNVF
jgi:hypothetical protein